MSFTSNSLLRAVLITNLVILGSWNVAGQVFELTLQNFDQYTKDKDVMLVEFFAPWCHHCQAFAPEWEKAAAALAVNREFILGRADCFGTGKDLCERFNIQMYPSVKLFRHGVFQEDFEGDRTADAVIRYLQQAQSQPLPPRAPDNNVMPNTDPWQSGASFQYAYPMANQPVQAFQPAPQPPVQTYAPTPELQQVYPSVARTETKPQQPGPPAPNGNFWFFNDLWNRNKPPAPSISLPVVNNIPAPAPAPAPPQYVAYVPPQKPGPELVQKSEASTFFEYNGRDNTPFQAQASATQIGLKAPSAAVALTENPLAGTFHGQLNAQNNQLGTSVIFIDGRPYAIRRLVNRYSNHHFPISLNEFQPSQRFGPGFLRGDNIPHALRPADNMMPVRPAPQRQIIPLRVPMPQPRPVQQQQTESRQKIQPVSKQPATNYFRLLSNFLQGKRPQAFESAQTRKTISNRPRVAYQPQPTINAVFESYKRKLNQEIQNQRNAKAQQKLTIPVASNARAPGRFVISIKGQAGSKAVAELKEKALKNPGFINDLLNSRSHLMKEQQQQKQILLQRQKQQQQQAQRRQQLLRQRHFRPVKPLPRAFANFPQTDRALIRAKVLRPDLMPRARWAAKGVRTGTTRGNIVYVPRSAFSRLPPWYRPKLGPALVKYVVKTDDAKKPFPMLAQANKKQALTRPAPSKIWPQIYNFYNRRNELQMREAPYRPKFNARPAVLARPNQKFNLPRQPALKPVNMPNTVQKYYVSQPQFRIRKNPNVLNKQLLRQRSQNTNPMIQNRYVNARRYPITPLAAKFNLMNAMNKKNPPPELWDKRSYIPQRPRGAGRWGTLKKKRSASAKERRHRNRKLKRHRRSILRKLIKDAILRRKREFRRALGLEETE